MAEFFKGWRRKVGVMTLVIACVFSVAWTTEWSGDPEYSLHVKFFRSKLLLVLARTDHFKDGYSQEPVFMRIIPYVWIIVPLTLLSAYLLLVKPRAAKPQIEGEST